MPTEPIHLSRSTCLPIMREAFRNKQLQAQQESDDAGCRYTGPCVIGVCVTPKQQRTMDNPDGDITTSIDCLIAEGLVTTDDDDWFIRIQKVHDALVGSREDEKDFSKLQEMLEL